MLLAGDKMHGTSAITVMGTTSRVIVGLLPSSTLCNVGMNL
jgi:hypothetical protein